MYGYGAVAGLVAMESFGVPVPGETTLIAASLLAATGRVFDIWFVVAAAAGGAVLGDNIGYLIGRAVGFRLLVRYGHYVRLTEGRIKISLYLFDRHGTKIVFFGRFVSVLRALAALLAGANCMRWGRFLAANAAGGIAWAAAYGALGYGLGKGASRLTGPVGIALGVTAAIVIIVMILYVRRREVRLEAQAERSWPGPLRRR